MRVPLGNCDTDSAQVERQIERVERTLRAKRTSRGPETIEFESRMADSHLSRHCVFMASGTCGLQVALKAAKEKFGWPDSGRVLIPATTFVATASAVRDAGLIPDFCDVDPFTGNISPIDLERTLRRWHVALVVVHLLGRAADMDSIMDIADRRGVPVIEDSCEAVGVEHHEDPVCTFGVGGAFSTYVCHHVSTGIGGGVLTNDDQIAEISRSLMVHGRDTRYLQIEDDDELDLDSLIAMKRQRYRFVRWGHSYRATEMEAALGNAQLDCQSICDDRATRMRVAQNIGSALAPWSDRICQQVWPIGSSPLFYPLICDTKETCDDLSTAFERADIETRPMMPMLTEDQPIVLDALAREGKSPQDFPSALDLTRRAFCIGCHPGITEEQTIYIGEVAERYFAGGQA